MKEVKASQASDGTLFLSKKVCEEYENLIEFDCWYNKDDIVDMDRGYVITADIAREWILKHKEDLLAFLNGKKERKPRVKKEAPITADGLEAPKKRRGRRSNAEIEAARLAELNKVVKTQPLTLADVSMPPVTDKDDDFVLAGITEEEKLREIEDQAEDISLDDILSMEN
jgi:hypothetical protein